MKLIDYIKGNRHGKDANRLERKSLEDVFLHDAIEGYDAVGGNHADIIARLQEKVTAKPKQNHRKLYLVLSMAASVAVLITVGTLFFKPQHQSLPIAKTEPKTTNNPIQDADLQKDTIRTKRNKTDLNKQNFISPQAPKIIAKNSSSKVPETEIHNESPTAPTPKMNASAIANESSSSDEMPVRITENNTNRISGIITDEKGEAAIGASVKVKGTNIGTITDFNGKFNLALKDSDPRELEISYIGFENKTVKATSDNMQIALSEQSKHYDDLVAVGYGETKKKDLVSPKKLENRPMASASETLQGKMDGVKINSSEGSPDADIKVRVRGGSSISQSNDPLYIVDGYPVSNINDIKPTDIKSIDVLKDASSTAIYGAQGANGVIVVTTKAGSKTKFTEKEFKKYFLSKVSKGTSKQWVKLVFTLDSLQKPSNIQVTEFSSEEAKQEAIRIIKESPRWTSKEGKIKMKIEW